MLITYCIFDHMLKKALGGRKDGSILLDYYNAEGLGLKEETFSFISGGYKLSGSRYFYEGVGPKAVVCFFHGVGGGRTSYLHLIAQFCKQDYLVYGFDVTGANKSEGPSIVGLGHYKYDLDAFFDFLDKDEKAKGLKRYAVGHSWGGYASMLSLEYPGIEKAIVLAGFLSPIGVVKSLCNSKFINAMGWLIQMNFKINMGKYGNYDAYKILMETKKPVFYIQGEDDHIVEYKASGKIVENLSKTHPNISTLIIKDRRHSCYLTNEAEKEVEALWADCRSIQKAGQISTDLEACSTEDPKVMKEMFDFLEK